MAKGGNHRKAPTGSSHKTDLKKKPSGAELGKMHEMANTVPTFHAARIDKIKEHPNTGGVKK